VFAVIPPSKDDSRPRETSFDRSIVLPRNRPAGRRKSTCRADHTLQDGYDPSPLSSSFIPGTTRKDTNGCTTALQCLRSAPADFYLRHSPRLRPLNHSLDLASTGHHPGSRSPSPVIDSRCTIGHVGSAC
jgi:hypothetical protein